jgi:hypothetical protein
VTLQYLTLVYDDDTLDVVGGFDGDFIDQVGSMFEHLFDRGLVRLVVTQKVSGYLGALEPVPNPPPLGAKVERRRDRHEPQFEVRAG